MLFAESWARPEIIFIVQSFDQIGVQSDWQHPGSFLAQNWQLPGNILAADWQLVGSLLATDWQQARRDTDVYLVAERP
jgi:hypothetical protein